MLNKILQIARREYLDTVKTKAFIIGIVILPVFMTGVVIFGGKLQQKAFTGPREDRQVAVVNLDRELAGNLKESFENYNDDNSGRKIVPHYLEISEEQGKEAVLDEDFDALLFVQDSTVGGDGHARLYSRPSSDVTLEPTLRRILNNAVSTARYTANGLSPELVRELSRGVWLEDIQLSDKGESRRNKMAGMMMPFFFMFIMFFGITTSSAGLLNSVIEEKTNRVIEVLLSAVSPMEMMAGKILGQSAIAMTLVGMYIVGGAAAVTISGFSDVVSGIGGPEIAVFVIYFVLGFLLFNSLYAAIGSAFNSLKEAQTYLTPVIFILISPIMFWTLLVQQPTGTLAVVLSIVPPLSPLVMIMRVAAMPEIPWLEVAVSLVLLAAAVYMVVWVASRIFRVGILMYGKPPTIREIARWVRES